MKKCAIFVKITNDWNEKIKKYKYKKMLDEWKYREKFGSK